MKRLMIAATMLTAFSALAQPQYFQAQCTPDKLFCASFSPNDVPVSTVESYMKQARKSIKIATYNMNVDSYVEVLKSKLNQGVKVEFLVDYKLSFDSNSVWRSLRPHSNLLKYRIPVMRGGNPQMHNKIIIIDDKYAVTGSANYTYSGLAGNYENVMLIAEPSLVSKYRDEFEELKNFSKITCEVMSESGCGTGSERYPADFDQFLKTGSFASSSLVSTTGVCQGLTKGYGLLTAENKTFNDNVANCFKEAAKYKKLTTLLAENEKKSTSKTTDKYQAYFSPEDNLESVILAELNKTIASPSRSFAYISVNFITNRKFAQKLVDMKRAGVRMKIFFDRGRFEDPNFKQSLSILEELGFSRGGDNEDEIITIFDNKLVGPYGCNHNKLAVIGSASGVIVLNGSANWSAGAMTKNDENLVIVKDDKLAAIYLREIISQLTVYRYGQNLGADGLQKDIASLSRSVPCLKSYLGLEKKCGGVNLVSPAIISVSNVPAGSNDRVWAWVPELNNGRGGAVEFFTHETFDGKWVSSIPMPLNATYRFKMFKTSKFTDPNVSGLNGAQFEYEGMGNDRTVSAASMAVHVIRGSYVWGRP